MAKVYTVNLGGKDRPLKFTPRDAITLKKRFGKPVPILLREDVMGMRQRPKTEADCNPGEKLRPGDTYWEMQGLYDLEVQIAFLSAGFTSGGEKVTEAKIEEWIAERMSAEQNMGPIIEPLWRAVFISGVLGASMDTEAEPEAETVGKE